MSIKYIVILFSVLALVQCKAPSTIPLGENNNASSIDRFGDYDHKFHYKSNDASGWTLLELDKEEWPEPIIGKDAWAMRMYRQMLYPAVAREAGVQGKVVLEVEVKRSGHVENVTVAKGVSPEIDAEAIRAYLFSIDSGYQPFYYGEAIMPFKFNISVNFRLQ